MRSGKRNVRKASSKPARRAVRKAGKKPVARRPARAAKPRKPARASRPAVSAKIMKGSKPRAAAVRQARPRPNPVSPRVQNLKSMLEAKGAEILEKIRRARADSLDVDRTHFAEVGDLVSASVEKEKAFEYGEAGVNAMREIAMALEKLKGGTYGKCERCSKPIGFKRLEAMPSARLCVKCKLKEEAKGKVAAPPADSIFED
jgi:RNA polymerase-binding protein DksA